MNISYLQVGPQFKPTKFCCAFQNIYVFSVCIEKARLPLELFVLYMTLDSFVSHWLIDDLLSRLPIICNSNFIAFQRTLHTDHQWIPHRFLSSMGINTFLKMQWMGMIRRIYGQNPNLTLNWRLHSRDFSTSNTFTYICTQVKSKYFVTIFMDKYCDTWQ